MSGVISAIGVILLLWLFAFPLADLYARRVSTAVIRYGRHSNLLALTFDDGPDPRYTPRLLDLLRESGARATFFLVGQRAAAHPEIVRRILQEGHEVAAHSQHHRHAYSLWGSTGSEVSEVLEALQQITGLMPRWYRPPWGAFNIALLPELSKYGVTPVLWSVNARDWALSTGIEGIHQRLKRRTHPGAIVVLHDAGGDEGAPENTLVALRLWLDDLQKSGQKAVTLSELMDSQNTKGA